MLNIERLAGRVFIAGLLFLAALFVVTLIGKVGQP